MLPRGARFLIAAALATPAINAQARGGRAAPGMIRGTVIDHYSSRPSVDRLVVVGKAKATTDIDGRFAIPAPAGPYDITVVDRNRSAVTFFRGLRRRDPVLLHYGDPNLVPNGYETHAAHIDGTLSGGGYDPKTSNMATVYFSSPQVVRDKTLGGPTYGASSTGFGPLDLTWIGPASITGTLIAVRTTREKPGDPTPASRDKGPVVWWEAHKDVKVSSGEVTTADLAFTRLPMGHIGARIEFDPGMVALGRGVTYFHARNRGIPLDGDGRETRDPLFDYPVPDLRHLPGRYCVNVYDGTRGHFSSTSKCGIALGATDVTIRVHAPPKLTSPAFKQYSHDRVTISRDTRFAWTALDGPVVYRLTLKGSPRINVYTTATSTAWPDLQSVGISFPAIKEGYGVSVTAFGPHAGMDEAFSPTGIATPFPSEMFSSQSLEPYVEVVAPGEPAVIPPAKQVDDDDEAPPRR